MLWSCELVPPRDGVCVCVCVDVCTMRYVCLLVCLQRPKAGTGKTTVPPHSAELLLLCLLGRQLSTCYSMLGEGPPGRETLTTLLPPHLWCTLATIPEMTEAHKVASAHVPEYASSSITDAVTVFTSPREEGQSPSLEALAPRRSADAPKFVPCDVNDDSPLARGRRDAELAAGLVQAVRLGPKVSWSTSTDDHDADSEHSQAVVHVYSGSTRARNGPPLDTYTLPIRRSRFKYSAAAWERNVTKNTVAVGIEKVQPSGSETEDMLIQATQSLSISGPTAAVMRSQGHIVAVSLADGHAADPVVWSLTCGAVRHVFEGKRHTRRSPQVDWSATMVLHSSVQQVLAVASSTTAFVYFACCCSLPLP